MRDVIFSSENQFRIVFHSNGGARRDKYWPVKNYPTVLPEADDSVGECRERRH